MMLGTAGALYALGQFRGHLHGSTPAPGQLKLAVVSGVLLLALAALLLWSTKGRQVQDWQALTNGGSELSYAESASTAIRLNLLEVGLKTFAQHPLLGFGPGTSTTEYLVPQRVVPVGDYHLAHVPAISHLHSVPLEILTRFGLVGVLIAVLLLAVLLRAYRGLWRDPPLAPDLRAFLTLAGGMTLLYCIYDFRIVNLDLRFFFILFFGLLYGLHLARAELAPPRIVKRHAAG
jgi:O-antigen ligase